MKTLFIPAKSKSNVNKQKMLEISKKLPINMALAYSIQYKNQAEEIRKILLKKHKITKFIQVLGCSKPNFPKNTSAILLIGSGRFHAISLALETNLPIYILEHNKLSLVSKKDTEHLKQKQKAAYVNFLNSNKIGILVSTKKGQENLKKAISLKSKLKDKDSYILIGDNINISDLENFNIKSWANTACPKLSLDDKNNSIINLDRL